MTYVFQIVNSVYLQQKKYLYQRLLMLFENDLGDDCALILIMSLVINIF